MISFGSGFVPLRLNSDPRTDESYANTPSARNMGVFDYTSEVADGAIKMINLFNADLGGTEIL